VAGRSAAAAGWYSVTVTAWCRSVRKVTPSEACWTWMVLPPGLATRDRAPHAVRTAAVAAITTRADAARQARRRPGVRAGDNDRLIASVSPRPERDAGSGRTPPSRDTRT